MRVEGLGDYSRPRIYVTLPCTYSFHLKQASGVRVLSSSKRILIILALKKL